MNINNEKWVSRAWFLTHLSNRKSGNNYTIKHEEEPICTTTFCYSEAYVLKKVEKKKKKELHDVKW